MTYKERVLARFAPPLAKRMHLELVEGIFTIWLSSLEEPEKVCWIVALASSKLARSIRKELDLAAAASKVSLGPFFYASTIPWDPLWHSRLDMTPFEVFFGLQT